jgi:hypothetical protein
MLRWMNFAVGIIVGSAVGLLFNLLQEMVRRRWTKSDEREHRASVRREQAADEVLDVLDDLTELVRDDNPFRADEIPGLVAKMERLALRVGDADARKRLEAIASSFNGTTAIGSLVGDRPGRIAFNCRELGRNAVSHLLSGEPLVDATVLDDYLGAIKEDAQIHEEMMRKHR